MKAIVNSEDDWPMATGELEEKLEGHLNTRDGDKLSDKDASGDTNDEYWPPIIEKKVVKDKPAKPLAMAQVHKAAKMKALWDSNVMDAQ